MEWSIYKDTSGEVDSWEPNDAAFYFDYDLKNASPENRLKFFKDGTVEVWFGKHSAHLEVVNGKFDIGRASEAIKGIVAKDGYWGTYIEGFQKHKGKIEVFIGS